MRLVNKTTGVEVKIGDLITTEDGQTAHVSYFAKPHKPSSTGKITVKWSPDFTGEYYVGVFGLEWIERGDE